MAPHFGFPRTSRLLHGWQFDLVFRTGRRVQCELVRWLFLEAPDGTTRIGMAVGKKQGKSFRRNRGRRLLREGVRRIVPWLRPGLWFVLTLRSAGLEAGGVEVYEDLARLLRARGFLAEDFPGVDWTPWEEKGP